MDDRDEVRDLIVELRALRTREEAVIERLEEAATRRELAGGRDTRTATGQRKFHEGDRVFIKNKIRRPANSNRNWTATKERKATVTRVTRGQVHFITDNNTVSWRAPDNLETQRHINEDDVWGLFEPGQHPDDRPGL